MTLVAHVKELLLPIVWILLAWTTVSPIIFIYWCWRGFPKRVSQSDSYTPLPNYAFGVFLGAWFAFFSVIAQGVSASLVFIPESWGRADEYGDFVSARSAIGGVVAFFATSGLFFLLAHWEARKK